MRLDRSIVTEKFVAFRICTKCNREFPLTKDYFHSAGRGGLRYDCKWCRRIKQKEYQNANIQAQRMRNKIHYYKDLEASRSRHRKWAKDNPKKNRLKTQRRRFKYDGMKVFAISNRDIKRLLASPCTGCGSCNAIEIDHIVPLSKGGRHSIGNLQPLCKSCNCSKGSKLMSEWRYRTSDTID